MRRGGHPMIVHPIGMMRHEHVSHGAQLERLAELTHQHQPPAGACNTWQTLYAGTARLTEDLIAHIHQMVNDGTLMENSEPLTAEEEEAVHAMLAAKDKESRQ